MSPTHLIDAAAVGIWNLVSSLIWLWALWTVVATPAREFSLGWRTKTARITIVLLGWMNIAGLFLPIGAVAIAGCLRRGKGRDDPPLPPARSSQGRSEVST